jgi:EmrB/QacA subfamily drug resistance transporter
MTTPVSKAVNKTAILAIVLVSYMMIVLDISIVITGLPKIHAELGFSETGLAWVQSAYTLAFGGFLLLGARAGDMFGRRRMLVIGLGIFTAASVVIGFAWTPEIMLVARFVQGFGSAVLAPSTLALLQVNFEDGPERTRAVAHYGAVAGIASSVGLVLGGILAEAISWRVGFFINLPVGIAMIWASYRFIHETMRKPGTLDFSGALTSTAGMGALVFGTIRLAEAGWSDPITLASLIAGVFLLVCFVVIQKNVAQPIMPLHLFASAERAAAYVGRLLFLGGMIGFWFFTTLFLQGVSGFTPMETGFAFLPTTIVNFAVAMMVPRLTHRFGNGRLLGTGLAISLFGLLLFCRLDVHSGYWTEIALPMILVGLGQGISLAPLTSAGIAGVTREDAGAASGVVNVAHQLGSSLGLGVLVAVSSIGANALSGAELIVHRTVNAFAAGSLMMAVALILVLALIVRPQAARNVKTA